MSTPPEEPDYGRVQSRGLTTMIAAVVIVLAVVTAALGLAVWAGLKVAHGL